MTAAHRPAPSSSPERASTLALAVLSAVTAIAFDRVFRDGSYLLPALGAALIPHAIGWLGRRRRWHPATPIAVSLLGLGCYAMWTAVGSTTVFGLPGPDTPHALITTLGDGWAVLRTGIAPVPATTGAVLLTVIALWIMATAADALAFPGEAPLGGIVPSLVIFVVASSLGPHDLGVWTTALYLVAALVFLAVCHRDLLEQRRSWFTARRGRGNGGTPLGVGAVLAAVAIVAGLVVAPALPGADADPLLSYKRAAGGPGRYESSNNPLVDLAARLGTPSPEERFTVESPERLSWRQVALDRFDGSQWTLESSSRAASRVLEAGPVDDNPTPDRPATVPQRFHLTGLTERWLPAAYAPVRISLPDARVLPESLTLFNADDAVNGLQYDVESQVAPDVPTSTQIAGTSARLPDGFDRFLELPDDFPSSIRRTARDATAGAATPYDRAIQLRDFFTGGAFTYDLDVPAGSTTRAMEEFLSIKRGFCQQFAGTYAAMARAVGLPSRVVVGFNPGTYDVETRLFRVTDANAHAWVEVWLAGLGWTLFEPTPAGNQPGATDPGIGLPAVADPSDPQATTSTSTAPVTPTPTPAVTPPAGGGQRVSIDAPGGDADGSSNRTQWIALGVAAVVLLLLAVRVGRGWFTRSRRRARRRNGPPRDAVVGAWAEALDRLDEHGIGAARADTPREVVLVAAPGSSGQPDTQAALSRLADATTLALWSDADPAPRDADRAWSDLEALEQSFRSHTRRRTRFRRALARLTQRGP